MIVTDHLSAVLLVTGAITALPVLQFAAPRLGLKLLYQLELTEEGGLFFTRHWGLLVGTFGALLVYAASHPALRGPVMAAAVVEKAALVAMILAGSGRPHLRGFRLVAAFDTVCVVLYGLALLGLA